MGKWTESCQKILFPSRSVCDRNTGTGAKGLWEWGSEPIKWFWVIFAISRRRESGRRWRGRWPSKIDSNWGKYCCCCWFCQKWPSNRIKNDSRIYEHPQNCSSSDSEREFAKEKVVCTICSALLDIWAKGRSSHILPRHYRDGRCRKKFFLTKLLWEMRPGVLPMTPKQSDRVLNGMVRHSLGRRNWNSKGLVSRPGW